MNAERLLAHYDRVAEAPDAIARLRCFVLDLAVRGKLVPQDPNGEPASELLKRIAAEKARLVKAGEIRVPKAISTLENASFPTLPAGWHWSRMADIGVLNPRNEAPDNQEASFIPMPLIPADYGVAHGRKFGGGERSRKATLISPMATSVSQRSRHASKMGSPQSFTTSPAVSAPARPSCT